MKDVIIACDFQSAKQTLDFLDRFGPLRPFVKIGMELFYAEGAQMVRTIKERGHKIFLDLKLHDIPNTVAKSMSVLTNLEVDMLNLHAAGGSEMMRRAAQAIVRPNGTRPLLIAVTMLTSTDQQRMESELLIEKPLDSVVKSYAKNAAQSGLDGVVCSPLEAEIVHKNCGEQFLTVTPGIRFAGGSVDDQARITTPKDARALGSDFIVVGRPITAAEDPKQEYERCMADFAHA